MLSSGTGIQKLKALENVKNHHATKKTFKLVVWSHICQAPTNYAYFGECAFSTFSAYECSPQLQKGHRLRVLEWLNLQCSDGRHPAGKKKECSQALSHWIWAPKHLSPRELRKRTCIRKMKMGAFASAREKLIMPPRSSFGRYLTVSAM